MLMGFVSQNQANIPISHHACISNQHLFHISVYCTSVSIFFTLAPLLASAFHTSAPPMPPFSPALTATTGILLSVSACLLIFAQRLLVSFGRILDWPPSNRRYSSL